MANQWTSFYMIETPVMKESSETIFYFGIYSASNSYKILSKWYSFVLNCRMVVGWGRGGELAEVELQTFGKNPQVHFIIIREWPKNNPPPPPILWNFDSFLPGTIYSSRYLPPSPLQLGSKDYIGDIKFMVQYGSFLSMVLIDLMMMVLTCRKIYQFRFNEQFPGKIYATSCFLMNHSVFQKQPLALT